MSQIYVNLIVENLPESILFYEAIGFSQNTERSDEKAAAMERDDNLTVMLLTKGFASEFLGSKEIADTHTTCGVLNALALESKEAVDQMFDKAISAGGKPMKEYDHGFMYGKDFEDIDGHIREPFFMDENLIPGSN